MKKLLLLLICAIALFGCNKEYDDSELRKNMEDLANRVAKLEELCKTMNGEISSMHTIVDALQKREHITSVSELADKSGYTITFAQGGSIVIKHGTSGNNDNNAPVIGIDIYEGVYYWTITTDGKKQWLTDDAGNKLRVAGENGTDGITPLVNVDETGYWTVSYDNGKTYTRILGATGKPIKAIGENGDSFFKSVVVDEATVTITLNDSETDPTVITIPLGDSSVFTDKDGYLTVVTPMAGQLGSILATNNVNTNDVTSLRIKGALNDLDFACFRGDCFEKLENLDMHDVSAFSIPIDDTRYPSLSNLKSLILPKSLKIINNAFQNTLISSIEIPASVETISNAFSGCSSLATITFEKGSKLKTLWGFSGCPITSIEIPASVETISNAFSGCSSLATITFEKGSKLKTLWGFSGCPITSIEIPASVETIQQFGNPNLETITFEQSSKLRAISIFGCFSNIELPNGVETIISIQSSLLTRIEIPASVETIKVRAFHGCSSLATVTFEQGSQLKTIGGRYDGGAFTNCPKLMTFDASACMSINEIQQYAFYQCQELRLFKIGTAVPPTCGASAFYGINPYSVLKVPSGCADTYKTANEWNNFASITGLDE